MASVFPKNPSVFLSGTYVDLKEYREAVIDAIRLTGASIRDFPDWSLNHDTIRSTVSRQIERNTDLFIGVFGFQYGTVFVDLTPPVSISQFEYELARRRWPVSRHGAHTPIYIFIPTDDPACAEREQMLTLARKAAEARPVGAGFPADEDLRRQRQWLDTVEQAGAAIQFCDRTRLCTRIVLVIRDHRGDLLEQQNTELSSTLRGHHKVLEQHLRRVGRKEQIDGAENYYEGFALAGVEAAPAACMLAWGRPHMGQHRFAQLIPELDGFADARAVTCALTVMTDARTQVWSTLWRAAGVTESPSRDVEALAAALAQACQGDPLLMVFENVQLYPGRFAKIVEEVWQPLVKSISTQWPMARTPHQLSLVLVGESADGRAPEGASADKKPVDYTVPLVLPELRPLTEQDVVDALERIGMPRRLRRAVAGDAIGAGDPDGVYYRLQHSPEIADFAHWSAPPPRA
jgi:hypothetical protein